MRVVIPGLMLVMIAAGPLLPSAERGPEPRRLGNDLFQVGRIVQITGPVAGDALLAGREVSVEQQVGGDAVVAARRVELQAPVGEDVYAAGESIWLSAPVSGSARMAGRHVQVTRDGSIEGGASLAGAEITVDGRVGPYLQVAGGEIRLNGQVTGDVEVSGGELSIGPNAVIDGEVRFRGPEAPRVSPSAQVRGGVQHVRDDRFEDAEDQMEAFFSVVALIWMIGWLVVGILLILLAPEVTRAAGWTLREKPWRALLFGLVLLIVMPFAIAVLAVTFVGIPLALVLVCAYLLLLALGYLTSIIAVSDSVLQRLRRDQPITTGIRILGFIIATIVLYLLLQIPVIGGLVAFLVLLFGMGALMLLLASRRSTASVRPA